MKTTRVHARVILVDDTIVYAWVETDYRKISMPQLHFGYVWARIDEHKGEWFKCRLYHL